MPKKTKFSDFIVSWFMYWIAIFLVLFMCIFVVNGIYGFMIKLPNMLELYRMDYTYEIAKHKQLIEASLLHFISFSVILVKAYKILISYAKHHHVSVEYIVEISIITSALEVLFNTRAYDNIILVIFWAFWIINLIVYMYYIKNFKNLED